MHERYFGELPDLPPGSLFDTRKMLSGSGIHRPTQAGISGSENEGADSVVLSGGYDDIDNGDEIVYTGHGGIDEGTGKQIADQELSRQNKALAVSKDNGYPIRVIRGSGLKSKYSPSSGYRYDGLYLVDDYWRDENNGFTTYKFHLVKIPDVVMPPIQKKIGQPEIIKPTRRILTTTLRVVRDTKKSLEVKRLYDYSCQVCGIRLEGSTGPYSEGAHIQPLGEPHNGPDSIGNIVCLCPNHHILFDLRAFTISDDLSLIGVPGKLTIKPGHHLNSSCLRYRREHY